MNSVNIPTLVVSVLLAAAFAAGVTFALVTVLDPGANLPPRPHAAGPRPALDPADNGGGGEDGSWRAEFRALNEQLAQLRNEMPAGVDSAQVDRRIGELTARLQRLEAIVRAGGPADTGNGGGVGPGDGGEMALRVPTPSELKDAIESVIEQRDEEARQRAEAERNAQIEEGLKRQREWMGQIYDVALQQMTTEAGLNAGQVDSMRELLSWRMEQLMLSRDQRVPREERPDWREVNDEFNKRVGSLLSPQQMQVYTEKNLGDFGRYQRDLQRQSDGNGGGSSGGGGGRGR